MDALTAMKHSQNVLENRVNVVDSMHKESIARRVEFAKDIHNEAIRQAIFEVEFVMQNMRVPSGVTPALVKALNALMLGDEFPPYGMNSNE